VGEAKKGQTPLFSYPLTTMASKAEADKLASQLFSGSKPCVSSSSYRGDRAARCGEAGGEEVDQKDEG